MKKIFAVILSLVLIFSMTACVASKPEEPSSPAATQPAATSPSVEEPATTPAPEGEETEPSVPTVEFEFVVVDPDGNEEAFIIATEKTIVGEALLENGLIAGEDGPYGLYVKTVNGITLDYDTDGMYWSFYVNGEYALKGVDQTEIDPAATYMIKAEKG